MVLEWQRRRLQDAIDVVRERAAVASAGRDRDVDQARDALALDHRRRRRDADICDLTEVDVPTGRRSDQEVADGREVAPRPRRAPDDDVEHALLLEQAAHDGAREQRRRCAPHVARLEPEPVRPVDVDLDLDRRLRDLPRDACPRDAVDPGRASVASMVAELSSTGNSSPYTRTSMSLLVAPVRLSLTFSVENASTWLPSPGYPIITFLIDGRASVRNLRSG